MPDRTRLPDPCALAGIDDAAAFGVDFAMTDLNPLNLRFASPNDRRALERLAELDSARPPRMPALVAEAEGELVAALSLGSGEAVADPFRATLDLVRMLELRAAQLRGLIRTPARASSARPQSARSRPPGRPRSLSPREEHSCVVHGATGGMRHVRHDR